VLAWEKQDFSKRSIIIYHAIVFKLSLMFEQPSFKNLDFQKKIVASDFFEILKFVFILE
jgi:hypothetical protein